MITKEAIEALEAARAHILDAYRIWQADDVSAVPPPKSGAGAVIAKIDAVLASPIAGEVKVNQLEWSTISFGDEIADSILGTYTITGGETYFVWFAGQSDSEDYAVAAPSMEAAKAAAQADYNTRILSALSSYPGKDGGQEVEAVSDRGEPCPHCKGEGYQTGDPEGAPLEACDYCNGSGKKISTQPASTALVDTAHDLISDWLQEGVEDLPDDTPVNVNIGGRLIIHNKLGELRSALSASQSTEGK